MRPQSSLPLPDPHSLQPDARGSIELCLSERLPDSFVMGGNQTLITTDECQNRN
jgi:hypothetical protein